MITTKNRIGYIQRRYDEEKYFQSVVDKWNEEPPKSIFD